MLKIFALIIVHCSFFLVYTKPVDGDFRAASQACWGMACFLDLDSLRSELCFLMKAILFKSFKSSLYIVVNHS